MHYAFDSWLEREFPTVEFERFADDAVVHCVTERQARQVWFLAVSNGFGHQVSVVAAWRVDEGVMVLLAA
jgi:hypothetical protein